jgi:PAS domain S-box-containing protein
MSGRKDDLVRGFGSLVFVVAGLVVGLFLTQHAIEGSEPFIGSILSGLGVVGIGIPLVVGGTWLWIRGSRFDRWAIGRILAWATLGGVPLWLLAVLIPYYQAAHGVPMVHTNTHLVWMTGLGTLGGMLTGIYDVFRRRRRRQQRQTADRLSTVVEAAPVSIVELAPDGTVRRWNDRAEAVFEWTEPEVYGQAVPFGNCGGGETFEAYRERALAGETVRNEPITCETREGDQRDFLVSVEAVGGASPQSASSIIAAMVDVTEQKRHERRLMLFKEAFENAGHAIYVTDPDRRIESVNAAFEEMTGYDQAAAVGADPSVLRSAEHDAEFYEELWATVERGDVWDGQVVNRRQSGERYTAHETVAPIEDGDEILGYVAIQRNVTTDRVQTQRITVLNRVLRHRLRTASDVIFGHVDALLDALNGNGLHSHAETIRDQAGELEALSEGSRRVERAIESARYGSHPTPLEHLVRTAVTSVRAEHPAADIETQATDAAGEQVDAALRPALKELVENAVTHSEDPEPSVIVDYGFDAERDQAMIRVLDDGPGIGQYEREPLQRGEETQLEHSSGIGLWLVKWVVTSLGGSVELGDRPAGGTAVTITVPMVGAGDDGAPPPASEALEGESVPSDASSDG